MDMISAFPPGPRKDPGWRLWEQLLAVYSGCVDTNPRPREPTPVIIDTATMVLPDALTIPARAVTSVTSTVEKSAMTQPPRQPPTQVFAQQRRSGCGTLLVALLALAIITAIVIFLGAFGLLGWIFS